MEETIGTRINETRPTRRSALSPDVITAACPYCIVMLTDGVTRKQQGKAADDVEVIDVPSCCCARCTATSRPCPSATTPSPEPPGSQGADRGGGSTTCWSLGSRLVAAQPRHDGRLGPRHPPPDGG